ncbi:MAG: polyamine ABC transporter substrate-binding protein [Proteobacteria bacterium]|nr:polyamine ABC transporter substrate-binding protein [Pseudomonadota bacterium]
MNSLDDPHAVSSARVSRAGWLVALLLCCLPAALAAQDRVLNVYNWSDYIAEDTVKRFTAETGIRVNYDVYDSNEVLETKLTAGRSGYDIVVPTASPFMARQIQAGLLRKLDRAKLANWGNLDPEILARLAPYDPGNAYAVPWMWGTVGIGYNVERVKRIMADAPVDSLKILFDPATVERFKACGVELLDSPTDVLPAALAYLGRAPESQSKEDLDTAVALLLKVRPTVRKFHSSEYINDLANGNACLVLGYSGDVFQAAARAREAGRGVTVAYAIPREGALLWLDGMVLPKDARNLDAAHRFLDFLMRPEIVVETTNRLGYANGNRASAALVDDAIKRDPTVYPPPAVRATLYTAVVPSRDYDRLRTRAWTRIKTGR